ncbi:MAG: SDR family NAD(P)-dependent oxidoreductase [Myxococcota bacterium]
MSRDTAAAKPIDASSASGVDLSGRVALVTGASHRLGRALALALAEAGADVAVHCRSSRTEAEQVADEIRALGRRAEVVQVDLADAAATASAFETARAALGSLDLLVNNVGTIVWKPFEELSPEDWRDCIDGTLFSTLHATQAVLPAMRDAGFGRVINILDADADASTPVPFATAYKIGKRATYQLTKTLAASEAEHGITINAVSPGTLEDSPTKPPLERIPAGRFGTYDDIAGAVLFLFGPDSAYLTGTHLKVSGGYLV